MREKNYLLFFIYTTFFVVSSIEISYSTDVSGNIIKHTRWTKANSPYIVTDDVFIEPAAVLTIEPGVVVKLEPYKSIVVGGGFNVRGTETDSIYFIRNVEDERWGTIKFIESSFPAIHDEEGNYMFGSIIEYALIEGAGKQRDYLRKCFTTDL